ncbi:glycosyltransferase family 4 protein [Parapedobacter lycopersici]|uniref:glycosyltransferase family 4 protein n=1 Tax=Parapedobacter lycopersici TaxID=1864939 RepID=UPI00214D8F24|nr:glycosyltransferase family 4 protein [Parapedobacter lycopersici]
MKGKRILFVANTAWSMYNFRLGLMKTLRDLGCRVSVAAPYDAYSDKMTEAAIDVIRLEKLRASGKNPFDEWAFYRELLSVYKHYKPDLIFHYTIKPNIYGVLAAKKLGIPTIAVTTGLGYVFNNRNLVSLAGRWLYRYALPKADAVWFLNREDQASFRTHIGLSQEKMRLLPGEGINTSIFERRVPLDFTDTVFLFTGRMLYEKGVEVLVSSVRRLRGEGYTFTCLLLGFLDIENPSAIPREKLMQWEKEGLITYLGSTDNVLPYLEKANCFVFPSYYSEGVPKSLLEAASMEMPIITTDNVGCRDVVEHGKTGLIAVPKSESSLAERMEQFLNLSRQEKIKMGQLGREKVRGAFGEDQVISIYLRSIGAMLEK